MSIMDPETNEARKLNGSNPRAAAILWSEHPVDVAIGGSAGALVAMVTVVRALPEGYLALFLSFRISART